MPHWLRDHARCRWSSQLDYFWPGRKSAPYAKSDVDMVAWGGIIKVMHTALLLVFTIFSLASFLGILWGADPYSSNFFIRILFFGTLFFALGGIFALLHRWISSLVRRPLSHEVAFRRGFLLATLSVALVVLQALSLLNLGNAFAVFLVIISVEMFTTYRCKTSVR